MLWTLLVISALHVASVRVDWTIEPAEAMTRTSAKLVSFNYDWHPAIEGPEFGQNASVVTIDLQNPRLRALSKAMAPAYLRIGGSEGDLAVYDIDGACARWQTDVAFCLTMSRWAELLAYAEDTGLDVVFGLNVMFGRNCSGPGATVVGPCLPWDPSNALALLEYTAAHGLRIAGFEVGNEKEQFLKPADYAHCMRIIRAAIDRLWPDAASRPLLIGPDENPRMDWLRAMLLAGGNVTDVITYHLYPGYGLDPSLSQEIVDPGFLDFTRKLAGDMAQVVRAVAPHAQLWVGETAASWHAGEAGITDAFESGFWFLDQLGTVASVGHEVMCRQCFVGGNYSMLGVNDGFLPRPDFWTGLLFKRLMGDIVLENYQTEPAFRPYFPKMRGYFHCARGVDPASGGMTFAFANLDPDIAFEIAPVGINLDGSSIDTSVREEWVLSSAGVGPPGPHQSTLSSLHIELNGEVLALTPSDVLPSLEGRHVTGGNFVAPPRTYGFVRFPQAGAQACAGPSIDVLV